MGEVLDEPAQVEAHHVRQNVAQGLLGFGFKLYLIGSGWGGVYEYMCMYVSMYVCTHRGRHGPDAERHADGHLDVVACCCLT